MNARLQPQACSVGARIAVSMRGCALLGAAFCSLAELCSAEQRAHHARPVDADHGLALIRLKPLPKRWAIGAGGAPILVEDIDVPGQRNWSFEFDLIRWIDDLSGALLRNQGAPIVYKTQRGTSRMNATWHAQRLKGYTFIAVIESDDDGALVARTIRSLERQQDQIGSEREVNTLMANEVAGFDEVRVLRRIADPSKRAERFRRFATETANPSFTLAVEGETQARRAASDQELHEIGLGLVDLSLREDVASYVRMNSAQFAEAIHSQFREGGDKYSREAISRLARALHQAAPVACSNIERTTTILRSLSYFVQASHDRQRNMELLDDLRLCREWLSDDRPNGNSGIWFVDHIEEMLKQPPRE
jgi:hypothetical protein